LTAVIRCQSCGREVEEGVAFCPHCGKPVAGEGAPSRETEAAPSNVVRVSSFDRGREEADKSRRVIFVAVAIVAALLVAGLAYYASRPAAAPGEERLEGAVLRPGSPDFPGADRLIVDFNADEDAFIGANALGNYVVTLKPTVRNFTGRAVSGLEFHAAGLDAKGQVIRERTFARDVDIEPNRVNTPALGLNFPPENRPAQLKLELTGVRFK
jgi:zinc-ribbon domain